MTKILLLVLGALLWGCTTGPEIVKGKGNIFGRIDARPHKEFLAKAQSGAPGDDYMIHGTDGITFTPEMVNYDMLDEIYVGLIHPDHIDPAEHVLTIANDSPSLRSILVGQGDVLKVRNNSARTLSFYLIDPATDDIQEYPALRPGQTAELPVNLEGSLELGADEDDALVVTILSVKNLVSRQVQSGGLYEFTRLDPGTYDVLFWFWRLGRIERRVVVQPDTNYRIDETLAVDRIIRQ
jgi:hypothetical protein